MEETKNIKSGQKIIVTTGECGACKRGKQLFTIKKFSKSRKSFSTTMGISFRLTKYCGWTFLRNAVLNNSCYKSFFADGINFDPTDEQLTNHKDVKPSLSEQQLMEM